MAARLQARVVGVLRGKEGEGGHNALPPPKNGFGPAVSMVRARAGGHVGHVLIVSYSASQPVQTDKSHHVTTDRRVKQDRDVDYHLQGRSDPMAVHHQT